MVTQIKKRYWMIYKITGDSGVDGKGTFLFQSNSSYEMIKFSEELAGMCDDRCNAYVVTSNLSRAMRGGD